jgi:hypothetical protein
VPFVEYRALFAEKLAKYRKHTIPSSRLFAEASEEFYFSQGYVGFPVADAVRHSHWYNHLLRPQLAGAGALRGALSSPQREARR